MTELVKADQIQKGGLQIESPLLQSNKTTIPETGQPREPKTTTLTKWPPLASRSLRLSLPDFDYESDSDSVRGGGVGGVKSDGVEESSVDSGRGSRGSTPPIHEDEDEEAKEEEDKAKKNVSGFVYAIP